MSDQEIEEAVTQYAPELKIEEVREFMAEHAKPDDEPDSHAVWAAKLLRQRGESSFGERASTEHVADALRQRDEP